MAIEGVLAVSGLFAWLVISIWSVMTLEARAGSVVPVTEKHDMASRKAA